jgi:hypothetical protein
LFPLPKIRNKRASSRSQKATVLTSSEHGINIKNKKTEKKQIKTPVPKIVSRRK